jgi:hypothetical protein
MSSRSQMYVSEIKCSEPLICDSVFSFCYQIIFFEHGPISGYKCDFEVCFIPLLGSKECAPTYVVRPFIITPSALHLRPRKPRLK